jgi:hypothetical protein
LLGVKGGLLGLQIGDQFFDPIKRLLIGDPGRQVLVVLDLDVEFDTLVTHFPVPHSRVNAVVIGCCLYDDEAAKMFSSILEAIGDGGLLRLAVKPCYPAVALPKLQIVPVN